MNFPVYDISPFSWNKYRIKEHNILYENPYTALTPINRNKFIDRIRNFQFVDSSGIIYKVVAFRVLPKKGLAKLLPFLSKIEFEFEKIDEDYSIDEFKDLLLKRARETQNIRLEEVVKKATSFKDILNRFT